MDASVRNAIMGGILKASEPKEVSEGVSPKESNEDKIYEFRHRLKDLFEFEKKIKTEAEDFDESNWKAFSAWLKQKSGGVSETKDAISQVLEKKILREKKEQEEKSAMIKKLVEGIKI